jgi:glycosyltransferase involved in cell wall biosynthesis
MAIRFSVVVPFYNPGTYIHRCAKALISLAYPAELYEIIMVDNNSTDESAGIVEQFDRITLLREAQQGSYAARNRGIRHARGEIVAFTDPDCVPRADWLEQIGRAMERPETGIVLGDRQFALDGGVLGMLAAYESELAAQVFAQEQPDYYYAYTNNMAIRAAILTTLGGFRTLIRGADSLFLRRAVDHYGRAVLRYAPQAVVRHLEIANIHDYLEKKSVYGRVSRNSELATPRALSLGTRFKLALSARKKAAASVADSIGFFGVLAAGAARFEWQRRQN